MITMFYKVELNVHGQDYASYNEGFIIAKFDEEKLKFLEGLFACDYLEGKIGEEEVVLTYYELSENYCYLQPSFILKIETKSFGMPLSIQLYDDNNGMFVEFITTEIYEEPEEIWKCKQQMQDFKTMGLFKTIKFFK